MTGLSCTIAQLDDVITYFWDVNNKHYRRFFEVIMALLIGETVRRRIVYVGVVCCYFCTPSDLVPVRASVLAQMPDNQTWR